MALPSPTDAFIPEDGTYPFRGLDTLSPSNRIPANFVPLSENIDFDDGVIETRGGYEALGTHWSDVDGDVIGNPIRALIDYEDSSGNKFLVCITTKHQLYYDTITNKWVDITKRETARAINTVNQGTDIFTHNGANRTSEFAAGVVANVSGSTGNNGVYTVTSSSFTGGNTEITVDQDIPHATANGTIAGDIEYATTATDQIDWTVGADLALGRVVIITNNVDKPRYWAGGGQFVDLSFTGLTSFVTCQTVEIVKDHLLIGNVKTTSRDEQFGAWSDSGNFNEFTSATTNAGAFTISDATGAIIKILRSSNRAVIFTEHSLATATFVGGDIIWSFETIAHGVNLISGRSAVDSGPYVVYPDPENLYIFDGTRLVQPIADRIKKTLRNGLGHGAVAQAFGFHDRIDRKVFWAWPKSTSGAHVFHSLDYNLYDIRDTKFSTYRFRDRVTAMGFFTRDDLVTWANGGTDPWTATSIPWDEGSGSTNFPVKVLGNEYGKVFLWDNSLLNDKTEVTEAGQTNTGIDSFFDTKRFVVPRVLQSLYGRWLEVEFEGRGTSVRVQPTAYHNSSSGGADSTSGTNQTVTLSGTDQVHKVHIDISGQEMSLRFRNNERNGWFKIKWLRVHVKAGGIR